MHSSARTLTFAAASTTTNALLLNGNDTIQGVEFPASMVGTALTFLHSSDGGVTFVGVKDVGSASDYSIVIASSKYVPVVKAVFEGMMQVKCVSNAAANADASKVLRIVVKPVA